MAIHAESHISIHALLAESDAQICQVVSAELYFYPRSPCGERRFGLARLVACINFYPRSPCGERPCLTKFLKVCQIFLSTLSLRRATVRVCESVRGVSISIHALLAESDKICLSNHLVKPTFLSTLSLRRATKGGVLYGSSKGFLSTLSLRRAT